eukprot:7391429-Prymnesium_polylepis.5
MSDKLKKAGKKVEDVGAMIVRLCRLVSSPGIAHPNARPCDSSARAGPADAVASRVARDRAHAGQHSQVQDEGRVALGGPKGRARDHQDPVEHPAHPAAAPLGEARPEAAGREAPPRQRRAARARRFCARRPAPAQPPPARRRPDCRRDQQHPGDAA